MQTKKWAYYNEIDPYAARWIRNLISNKIIMDGEVDERSITEVKPEDVKPFLRVHAFAGIAIWDAALRCAGWPDDKPVWTGSCPCQPFSSAGKGEGFQDERHLWPVFFNLIKECKPTTVFGEQVTKAIKFGWLDLVQADLEACGYAFGTAGLSAAGVGAPHARKRLYFVADSHGGRCAAGGRGEPEGAQSQSRDGIPQQRSCSGSLVNATGVGQSDGINRNESSQKCSSCRSGENQGSGRTDTSDADEPINLADRNGCHQTGQCLAKTRDDEVIRDGGISSEKSTSGPTNGFWRDADWLYCRDGKWRPVEPGTFPLAHGAPARVGRLRAYGNALCKQTAEVFIQAFMSI